MSEKLYPLFICLKHFAGQKRKKLVGFLLLCSICKVLYAQPTVAGIAPVFGATGTTVTITGTNFDPITTNNIVYFGAVKATVLSAFETSLLVAVPLGSTHEPVTVTTKNRTAISDDIYGVTFSCGGSIKTSSFTTPYTIPGNHTYNIRNADIDGDGKTDIVYSDGGSIIVLKNNSSLTTPSFVQSIVIPATCCFKFDVSDLNGDGKLDIVAPSSCNDLISVLENTSTAGNISFSPKTDYTTGDLPYAVAVGNLDEDGRPDIAVVNMDGNTLSVFKNLTLGGPLSFGAKADYVIGRQGRDVAIADLDGDGKADVIVPSQSDQYVSLFRNESTVNSIVLSGRTDLPTVSGAPEDVVVTDFDGDGKPDLALSNNNVAGNVSVFRNASTAGSFSFSQREDFSTGPYPFRISATDLNGDGKPDLAVKDQYTSTVTLLENTSTNGSILFAPKVDLFTPGVEREHLTIGDFNNDGKPDLAVSDNSNFLIFLNSASPLSVTATYTLPTCSGYNGTITAKAFGGKEPYQYQLGTLPYQTTGTFTKLPPDGQIVRIKDATGCIDSVAIILPSNYLWFTIALTDANCNQNDGSIIIDGSGTNLPLSYSLNGTDFQSSPQFTGLAPGIYNVYVKDAGGCTNQTGFVINSGCVTVTPTVTNATCGFRNGRIEVQVSGGSPPYQYSLDGIQYKNTNQFLNLLAGDYTVYARDAAGKTVTVVVNIDNIEGAKVEAVNTTPAECNNSNGTATLIASGGTPPFQYALNATLSQPAAVFSSLAPGTYTLSILDSNGCSDSSTVTVPVNNNLTITAGVDLSTCEGEGVLIDASSNGSVFSWSPTTALNNSAALKPVAAPDVTTTYIVTTTLGVCEAKDTVVVQVNAAPVADAGKDVTICPEQSITLSGSGGVIYSWSPTTYLSGASNASPVMSGAPKGEYVYSLSVKDDKGCTSLQSSSVHISVVSPTIDAGRDTVVLSNALVQLQAIDTSGFGFVQYNWSPTRGLDRPDLANPIASIDQDIVYTVTAQTTSGCTATDKVSIKVYNGVDIYVPTAFTPNGDGKNDVLRVIPVGIKELRHFRIYNRWGQLLFQTTNPSTGWDGRVNGLFETGTVVWIAEGIDYRGNVIKRKGTTTIIR